MWKMLGKFTEISTEKKRVTVDIETYDPFLKDTGASWVRNAGSILGIAIKLGDNHSEYYPLNHIDNNFDKQQVKNYIQDLFKHCYDHQVDVVGHYLYYDLGWLDDGNYMSLEHCPPLFDTLVMSQLHDSSIPNYSLGHMAKLLHCGEKIDIDVNQLRMMPMSVASRYACNDADITDRLALRLLGHGDLLHDAIERENGVIPILCMMHRDGIRVDMQKLEDLDKRFTYMLTGYMKQIMAVDPKVQIWSGASIEILFRKLGIGYPRTQKGNPSFDQEFLEATGKINPVVNSLYKARKLHKLKNTFLFGIRRLQVDGILHPDYFNGRSDYGGTVTGRLSSANPNIQQVPARTEEGMMVRECFIPLDGPAWCRCDYSQQEPRIMLHYASLLKLDGIDYWKGLYSSNPDQDFYDVLTQLSKRDSRHEMKTMTLGVMYGMGPKKMAFKLGIPEEAATQMLFQFFGTVPWMKSMREFIMNKVRRDRTLRTLGDRKLMFPPNSDNKAFNHLIQGSAADQTKQAMIDVWKELRKIPLCQVHDELGYGLTKDDLEGGVDVYIEEIMRDAIPLEFPVKVDTTLGRNWRESCE